MTSPRLNPCSPRNSHFIWNNWLLSLTCEVSHCLLWHHQGQISRTRYSSTHFMKSRKIQFWLDTLCLICTIWDLSKIIVHICTIIFIFIFISWLILYSLWLMCHINNFKGLVHSLCTIQTTNWIPCQCTVIHSLYVVITNLYDYNDTIHRNKWAIWGIVIPGRSADQHVLCRGSEPRTEVWSLEEGVRNIAALNRMKCELGQC